MRTVFGFLIPLLITMVPLLYLVYFGVQRLRNAKGESIFSFAGKAFLMGLATPILAIIFSIPMLSTFDDPSPCCNNFLAGYIGLGMIIEIVVIPLTMVILVIIQEIREGN